uniref:Uncharacterized protein n=1 Tax=Anopheles marajoara TaxID=58244 RepID=A0A2M4C2G6_9DIPT
MLSPPNGSSGNAAAEVPAAIPTNGNNNGAPFDVVATSSGTGAVVNTSLLRPNNLRYPIEGSRREPQLSVNSNNFDNASVLSSDSSTIYGYGGVGGDPNQVGLPPSVSATTVAAQKRWIPQQQRELLEKQAQLLLSGASVRRKRETEIF